MDSSSNDLVEEQNDEDENEGLEGNAIRGSTMPTTGSVTSVASMCSLCSNLSRQKQPRSVVWKFFNTLQGRKSVQCQLCPVGNNDDLFAYHGGTSSMHEHFKETPLHCIL